MKRKSVWRGSRVSRFLGGATVSLICRTLASIFTVIIRKIPRLFYLSTTRKKNGQLLELFNNVNVSWVRGMYSRSLFLSRTKLILTCSYCILSLSHITWLHISNLISEAPLVRLTCVSSLLEFQWGWGEGSESCCNPYLRPERRKTPAFSAAHTDMAYIGEYFPSPPPPQTAIFCCPILCQIDCPTTLRIIIGRQNRTRQSFYLGPYTICCINRFPKKYSIYYTIVYTSYSLHGISKMFSLVFPYP